MEWHQFTLLHDMEDTWWYKGRSAVIVGVLGRAPRALEVLDFGAAFGGMFSTLARFSTHVTAFEPNVAASAELKERGYIHIYPTTEEALAGRYNLIGLFDVVEHIKEDRDFLTQLKRSLAPDGKVIITVPAYQWIWSPLDIASNHFRRYTKKSLIAALHKAGYQIEFASYWNMFLFPIAAVVRLAGSAGEGGLGLPAPLNYLFLALIRLEAFLIRFFPLPFGLSIIALVSPRQNESYTLP